MTVNAFGQGEAYYIAARTHDDFLDDFYTTLASKLTLRRALEAQLPVGVTAQVRTDGEKDTIFVMNFTNTEQTIPVLSADGLSDLAHGGSVKGPIVLPAYGVQVLVRMHG